MAKPRAEKSRPRQSRSLSLRLLEAAFRDIHPLAPRGKRCFPLLMLVIAASSFLFPLPLHAAGSLRVAVTASFRETMRELDEIWKGAGLQISLSSASTGALTQQALRGAPFDVLLAADRERPRILESRGGIVAGSRRTYAIGQLVLWSADSGVNGPKTLFRENGIRIALADHRLAPYGQAAREVLKGLGALDSERIQFITGRDLGQVFQFAASGLVDGAFIAHAQVLLAGNALSSSSLWVVPADLYAPIEQQAVILATTAKPRLAWQFLRLLTENETVLKRLRRAGYGVVNGKELRKGKRVRKREAKGEGG